MISLYFVVDGERDRRTVPILVQKILQIEIHHSTTWWQHLHDGGTGYKRKANYALREAKRTKRDGLVVVVDRDKDRKNNRRNGLDEARRSHRKSHPPFPMAIGVADPHGEAWILDDPKAVRDALALSPDIVIQAVTKCKSPKEVLELLHRESGRSNELPIDVWEDIARAVDLDRCTHAHESGFETFRKEIRSEIAPLVNDAR